MAERYNYLIKTLISVAEFSKEEIDILISSFKLVQINKGDFFLKEGDYNNKFGFINYGLMRYFVNNKLHESTIGFSFEGEFVTDYQSFRKGTASRVSIQAIEDSQLLVCDKIGFQELFSKTKNGNLVGRLMIESRYERISDQLLSLYIKNPEERYMSLLQSLPRIFQRVPQYYLASFIGIKPESLSRIRKRIIKKNAESHKFESI